MENDDTTPPDADASPAATELPVQTPDEIAAPYFRNAATRRIIAVVVVFAWLFVFAFGLLIPAESYRKILGWDPTTKDSQTATELQTKIKELEKEISQIKAKQENKGEEKKSDAKDQAPVQTAENAQSPPATPTNSETTQPAPDLGTRLDTLNKHLESLIANPPKPAKDENKLWAFIVATISFMPINIAVLCILAGCIGACCVSEESVKDVLMQLKSADHSAQHDELRRKLNFLTEHPLYSALRGLVVYLLLSSGLFIFAGTQPLVGDIEQTVSLASYIRLSGIFSFLSYLAGHDPTVFTNMIRMGNRQSVEKAK